MRTSCDAWDCLRDPSIHLHLQQTTIGTQLDHLLFLVQGLASPFELPVVEDGHIAQLDVDLGDAALLEPKSFQAQHGLAGVWFPQRRFGNLIQEFRPRGESDEELFREREATATA